MTAHHQAFINLPQTLEMTRKNLAAIPAKKATDIIGKDLQDDIVKCSDKATLEAIEEVLKFLTGAGRFKKDLGGVDLSTGLKNVCRSSINKTKDGVLKIVRPGIHVHKTVWNPSKDAAAGEGDNSTAQDPEALKDTMAARQAHEDVIAGQNKNMRVSGGDTSAQAAKLVGEAQKVARCALCTKPMGDQSGRVCKRCQ